MTKLVCLFLLLTSVYAVDVAVNQGPPVPQPPLPQPPVPQPPVPQVPPYPQATHQPQVPQYPPVTHVQQYPMIAQVPQYTVPHQAQPLQYPQPFYYPPCPLIFQQPQTQQNPHNAYSKPYIALPCWGYVFGAMGSFPPPVYFVPPEHQHGLQNGYTQDIKTAQPAPVPNYYPSNNPPLTKDQTYQVAPGQGSQAPASPQVVPAQGDYYNPQNTQPIQFESRFGSTEDITKKTPTTAMPKIKTFNDSKIYFNED